MAAFDPDAFLKGSASAAPAFDPDAFLKGGASAPSGGAYAAKELAPGQAEQGLRRRKLEELVQAKGEPGYGTKLADSFTWGLIRPVSGALAAAVPEAGTTAGERYRAAVGAEEDYANRASKNVNPYLGAAADVVGSVASGGPATSILKGAAAPVAKTVAVEAPSKVGQLAKYMVGNTGQGVIEGAARNADTPEHALTGGLIGGGTAAVTGKAMNLAGKAASPVVNALTDRFNVNAAKKVVAEATERGGGSAAVKEAGGEIYKKLDNAGIKFKDATPLVQDTIDKMKKEGFNYASGVHGDLVPVAERIAKLNGKETTWNELQQIREQLSAVKASDNKQARRMAGHLSDTLDEFVDTAKPTIPINKIGTVSPGDPAKARDLWRRGSQAETAEFLEKKGMATATDPNRKLQTNFGSELDKINNPKRFSAFQNNPEQKAQIEKLAVGDPKRAALASFLSKQGGNLLSFGGLGLAGGAGANYFGDTTGIGGGVGAGGATSLGLGLLGKGGARLLNKGIANRASAGVNDLVRNIVTGSAKRGAANVPREALAKVLAAEQLKRGVGRYASGKATEGR